MNWVGGSRHRLKYLGEKKIQREFFERQKFGLKTAKRQKLSPTKKKQHISQDLKEIMTINNTHSESLPVIKPISSRQIKNVDFDKYEQRFPSRRVTEDVQLDSSPIKTPSKIQLMEARTEQKSHHRNKDKKSHLFAVPEEAEEEVIFEDENIFENRFGPTLTKRQILENEPTRSQLKMSLNEHVMDYNSIDQTPQYNNFYEYGFDRDIKNNLSVRQTDVMSSCSMMQAWKSPDNHHQNNKIHVNTFQNILKPLKPPVENHDPRNFKTPSAFCSFFNSSENQFGKMNSCDMTKNNLDDYRSPEMKMTVLTPLKTPLLSPILNSSGEALGKMEIDDQKDWQEENTDLRISLNNTMDSLEMKNLNRNIENENKILISKLDSADDNNIASMYQYFNSTETDNIRVSTESPLPKTVSNYVNSDYRYTTGENLGKLTSDSIETDQNLDHDIECYIKKDNENIGNLTPISVTAEENLDYDSGSYKVNNMATQTSQDISVVPCKPVRTQLEEKSTQTSQDISNILCKKETFTQTSPDISIKIQTADQSVQTSLDISVHNQTEQLYSTKSDAATSPIKNLLDLETHLSKEIYTPED